MSDTIPSNTSTTATISLGQTVFGVVDFAGDQDWYRIDLAAGTYSVRLDNAGIGDPYLYVYDANGSFVAANDDSFGSLNSCINIATGGGTFYLGAGGFSSRTGQFALSITRDNGAPIANADMLAPTAEDLGFSLNAATLVANDSDADGDALSVTAVNSISGGSVSFDGTNIVFTPSANFTGIASFNYTVNDGRGGTANAVASFNVTPVNDAPIARDDGAGAGAGTGSITMTFDGYTGHPDYVFEGFSFYDNGDLGADGSGDMAYAFTAQDHLADGADGIMRRGDGADFSLQSIALSGYTNAHPTRMVGYRDGAIVAEVTIGLNVNESFGGAGYQVLTFGAAWGSVDEVRFYGEAGEFGQHDYTFIDNVVVGDAGGALGTVENSPLVIDVLANDSDIEGGALTIVGTGNPAHGSVAVNADGTITYTPDFGYEGNDSFTYTVADAQGLQSTATVMLTVTPLPYDGPTANADATATGENAAVSGNAIANDLTMGSREESANLLVNGSFENGHGIGLNSYGVVGSLPGWTAVDGIEVWGNGFLGNAAADGNYFIELDQGGAQDAYSQTLATEAGRNYKISFDLAVRNGTAPSTNQVEFLVNGVSLGVFTPTSTSFATFEVSFTGSGNDVITFREPAGGNDGVGGLIDNLRIVSEAQVQVTAVNDSGTGVGQAVAGSTGGSFVVAAGGSYDFDPGADFDHLAAGETATTSVAYTVADIGGSASSTITVIVTGTNDGPVAVADSGTTTENAALTVDVMANDTDVDNGDTKTLVSASTPKGSVAVVDGKLVFDPGAAFDHLGGGASEVVAIGYTVRDAAGAESSSTVTITVTGSNDGPVAVADTATTGENAALTIDALANDTDLDAGDAKSIVAATTPRGSVAIVDGKLAFDPGTAFDTLGAGASETVTIAYTMRDAAGAEASSTATATVTGANDGPTAANDSAIVAEDQSVTGNVIAGSDSDIDLGDVLTVAQVNGQAAGVGIAVLGTYGTLLLGANGNYSYAADADVLDTMAAGGAPLVDSFSYAVSDGKGGTATASLNVTVTVANDVDSLNGTSRPDVLNGDRTQSGTEDTIRGDNGNDAIDGKAGADRLYGENGDDRLVGGSGRDFLDGGNGNDRLEGGDGNDMLFGGRGDDLLIGGAGADVFVFLPGNVAATGNDVIAGFELGSDRLSLQGGLTVARMVETNGDTVLHLSSGGSVTIEDVTTADWSAINASIDLSSQLLVA